MNMSRDHVREAGRRMDRNCQTYGSNRDEHWQPHIQQHKKSGSEVEAHLSKQVFQDLSPVYNREGERGHRRPILSCKRLVWNNGNESLE